MNLELKNEEKKKIDALAAKRGIDPKDLAHEALDEGLKLLEKNGSKANSIKVIDPAYEPSRTALGRRLREIRKRYIEGGGKIFTIDEINREVAENRGECD